MPRIPPSLLRRAFTISPLLPLLLRACRTLPSAQNELRWLREHAAELTARARSRNAKSTYELLTELCRRRSRGAPLQYLLGSAPFGELDILCRPGVLIPRPETEAYSLHLAELIRGDQRLRHQGALRILDLCSGTGCISLSLYSSLWESFSALSVVGVDVSPKALELARRNLRHNMFLPPQALAQIKFVGADILREDSLDAREFFQGKQFDVVVSNPPYISKDGFNKDTARSVRIFEPRLALVPPDPSQVDIGGRELTSISGPSASDDSGPVCLDTSSLKSEDVFYPRILNTAYKSDAKIVLMEVADLEQALRVCRYANDMSCWNSVEVYRDWPDETVETISRQWADGIRLEDVVVKGQGSGRSVMCRKL